MNGFVMNGYLWRIRYVDPYDLALVDRTGRRTVGTTDPSNQTVYLSNSLHGEFLTRVLVHELGHCALVSFHLLDDIHRITKKDYWIYAEEFLCNWIADYGLLIFEIAKDILGYDAWICVPYELEKMITRRYT